MKTYIVEIPTVVRVEVIAEDAQDARGRVDSVREVITKRLKDDVEVEQGRARVKRT